MKGNIMKLIDDVAPAKLHFKIPIPLTTEKWKEWKGLYKIRDEILEERKQSLSQDKRKSLKTQLL